MNALKTHKKEIDHIRVHPAVDGIHVAETHWKRPEQPDGKYVPTPEPEPHFLTGGELLAHIGKHLGIKGAAEEKGEKEHK